MRPNLKAVPKTAVLVTAILLSLVGFSFAQQQINLSAGPSGATLPDGSTVPMWGYSCGVVVTGSTASCSALNKTTAGWSPVVITVPTGQDLQINLTNNLSFTAGTTTNSIPTSLVIVGQLGGGLGDTSQRTTAPSPNHATQQTTWPIAGSGATNTPPPQGARVQSFSTEVAAGATTSLTWKSPRPGTYLLESGTHPSIQGPMGLYGIVVVTTAPAGANVGTAYPGVSYSADIPLLFSEIDPVQNSAVQAAVTTSGFSEAAVWSGQPGGCGNPSSPTYHQCYPPAVNYTPLYYLINGVAFDKTNAAASLFAASPSSGVSGSVLVRLVNAGLRMHVPSIVGSQTGTASTGGFSLIAEDGNPLPGVPRVQSEVFMAAGKAYDVLVNTPVSGASALPVYDRELSLSGNATARDAGMLAYVSINGAGLPSAPVFTAAIARDDTYNSLVPGQTLTVSDASKGLIANDTNVSGVQVLAAPTGGTLTLNADGTFSYVPNSGTTSDSFTYCANGTVSGTACSSGISAKVVIGAAAIEANSGITVNDDSYASNVATTLSIKQPGVLANDSDAAGYPLVVDQSTITPSSGLTVVVNADGSFAASVASPGTYTFTYKAKNSQGTQSASAATVTLVFPKPSNLAVKVVDGKDKTTVISDYRWIIEEDRTFYVDPTKTTNNGTPGTTTASTYGVNFHTSYMPVVAEGCTGPLSCESGQTLLGAAAVCDLGNGSCRTDASQQAVLDPSQVALDPNKHYYISILPGDAANPFNTGNAVPGHTMGGAQVFPIGTNANPSVTVLVEPTPLQPAKLSVFVFQDDFPLNGENDAGGGVDVLSPNEPGLGGFNIELFDDAGGTGDATGQMTYDMFNMPLSNALAGTPDPANHGIDACPISQQASTDPTQKGITGMIVTCPKYEADGKTPSPLAGQAVVANLMPGRYGVVATPAADRIARGEEWLQTNTLDGQKAHDSFLRVGEPSYFQEFGPAGYHVSIGFANPSIINSRLKGVCSGTDPNITGVNCTNTVKGLVTTERMSRTPDERLFSSGSNDSFSFTQCYVSFGDPDGEDFAFTKCNADGTFSMAGLPDGDWRITVFDQWNDMLVDGLSTPVRLGSGKVTDLGQVAMNQWQANVYTSTFVDLNGNGVRDAGEPGLSLVPMNNRYRDGSFSNFNSTDLNGVANFNEVFPLFNWYVLEADTTRYKNTGTHVVYDAGGPADGTPCGTATTPATAPCGSSNIAQFMANTYEANPVPGNLHVPGAVYCNDGDCTNQSIKDGPNTTSTPNSTSRIDPPWVLTEGWQGFSGQNSFLEFGKTPYLAGENGGIRGHVVYASTRPFDDPQLLLQTSWEPLVPNVTINLYQEGTAPDGSRSLKLVDTTKTSSFDDWAQGFRADGVPNMNCPGQSTSDLFYFSLYNQPMYLDAYNNGGTAVHTIPNNSQFKCYDGMHNWNQLQPAPYDGMYQFPSITSRDPVTGKAGGSNCTICTPDPDGSGSPMLPAGKYVVEVVVPPGYELVKEEDKNILIGDNYIAPVTQQFGGLGSIFILPDQAQVASAYNANNPQNPTQALGRTTLPSHEGDTGSIETYWPCVGDARIVPDYISLYPQSGEVAPFAGATRNLCDRKEVTLDDQASALAKFYIFTSTHVAAHFTGVITDDFTSEFDPFSPQFGEKFAPPDLPISIKDFNGNEISRVYADHWGAYNGLNYSTWEVNPPNPTGYAPTMMVTCMNDPGPIPGPNGTMITDPLYNSAYSQFCYEIPFMPGQTQYMDTPVVPTSAFAGAGYNNPDCAYPDATPAISEVDGDGVGPWVSASGKTLTIKALGDQTVNNYGYAGPSATTAPFNQKTTTRHYGFGASQGTGSVTIGGISAPVTSWSDTQIVVTVPNGVPSCSMQQQAQYGGLPARCGELVITAGNGKQSVDSVTVTVGGKAPTVLATGQTIQSAIDGAKPGDLIIVPAGTYNEMVLMWKPVRLQGVGAASTVINANTHPAGKLDPWRRQVACLFGIALNGTPITSSNPFDPSNQFTCTSSMRFAVDRLPLEATVGWDATLNGNLAELLQEPTLMGAYEGAGITVMGKGVDYHGGDPYASDTFPTGTTLLTAANCGGTPRVPNNPFPSNFQCNPSRIDGLSVTNSSQGGGGVFAHAWAHNLEISNNRVRSNTGTLAGGISIGQGEFPPSYAAGPANAATNAAPGSCQTNLPNNTQEPYCFDLNVNVHHNSITSNSSIGDELFSATPSGPGGVAFCTGSDYYKFNYNWLCGNMSTGDGGGLAHLGFSYNGDIEHNSILFNQSLNPTIPTNGGGIVIHGTPDVDPACGATTDADCAAPGMSDGTGPGLVINANLFQGNAAESGSGGAIRLQGVNGTDVATFPRNPNRWYSVAITNNIISNNVAGWDGAGVSLQDALAVKFVNNTVVSNDTTASAGVLFNTLGAPVGAFPGPPISGQLSSTGSAPQPAGLVSIGNSPPLLAALAALPAGSSVICPPGNFAGTTATNGTCTKVSYPYLANNVFWQNRSFYIGVGALGSGTQNQQNVVALYNAFSTTPAPSQPQADATAANGAGTLVTGGTGACVSGTSYWDVGIRGDTGPSNHGSGFTLSPTYSVLTDASDYPGAHNTGVNPTVLSQYCNGSRIPPELGSSGYQVPPGISDATVPNPIFSLTPAATVDEGNNWINMTWGPLSLVNPVNGKALGDYSPASTSSVINLIPISAGANFFAAPSADFFGNPRKTNGFVDAGAVEYVGPAAPAPTLSSITPATGGRGQSLTVTLTGTNLTGTTAVAVAGTGVTVSNIVVVNGTTVTATFTVSSLAATGTRNVSLTTSGGTTTLNNAFTVQAAALTSITPAAHTRGGAGFAVTLTGTDLTGSLGVAVSGTGITVSNLHVVNDTTVTATFTISGTATRTVRSVRVATPNGNFGFTNAVNFTVQ